MPKEIVQQICDKIVSTCKQLTAKKGETSEQKKVLQQIFDKIVAYDTIIVTRHCRPDGDAIGSSKGLARMLQLSFPQKKIYLQTNDSSDYLAFLGKDDEPVDAETYTNALVIVTDTATKERASNSYLDVAKEVIKIDHHIDVKPYGDLCWIEDWRSSTCEMIAYFYQTFSDKLVLDKLGATYVFCGMVTDSGRFRYESTTPETLRLAGMLLELGVDTEQLYAHLYLEDFDTLRFQSYVYRKMNITPNGVAYLHVDKKMQRKFHLTSEQASEAISYLKGIKGAIAQIAFIDMPNKTIRVRLRSRFMTINSLAEQFNGGGHAFTCGATLTNKKEIALLLGRADEMVADYKANNKGWM